jgi:hypothetical protein
MMESTKHYTSISVLFMHSIKNPLVPHTLNSAASRSTTDKFMITTQQRLLSADLNPGKVTSNIAESLD